MSRRKHSTAIVLKPRSEGWATLQTKKVHRWVSVGYNIAVELRRVQKGMDTIQEPDRVVGRAMGMREDGQCFFSVTALPWLWNRKKYRWRDEAKARLDTFLLEACDCRAYEGDISVCEYHQKMLVIWRMIDDQVVHTQEELQNTKFPLLPKDPGAVDFLRVMHRDYPWCRYDVEKRQWVCLICKAHQDAYDNNSSYRNIFIRRHGECGFKNPYDILPPSIEDQVLERVVEILSEQYQKTGERKYDDAHAIIRDLRSKVVVGEEALTCSKRR